MCESYGHGYGCTILSRCVYKDGYKYVVTQDDLEQLYDLKKDPFEMDNLAMKDGYSDRIIIMRDELRRLQKESRDPVDLDGLLASAKRRRC